MKLLPPPVSASFGLNCFVTVFLSIFDVAGLTEFLIGFVLFVFIYSC